MEAPAPRGDRSSPAHPVCSQIAVKSVQFLNTEGWSKELLWALTTPDRTQREQPPEKVGRTLRPHEQPLLPVPGRTLGARPGAPKETRGPDRSRGAGPGRGKRRAFRADGDGQRWVGLRTGSGPSLGLPVCLLRADPSSRGEWQRGPDAPANSPGNVPPVAQAERGEGRGFSPASHRPTLTTRPARSLVTRWALPHHRLSPPKLGPLLCHVPISWSLVPTSNTGPLRTGGLR